MPGERSFLNRLNDLTPREWVKFQKSWFIHNPPSRKKAVLRHPAKFPETLAQEFIEFFTKRGQTVLDPMVGTGSTLVACLRSGRHGIGIELNPHYAEMARRMVEEERRALGAAAAGLLVEVIEADAGDIAPSSLPSIDYILTSPPYWDMLRARGAQTQRTRRASPELDVYYSEHPADLGNISDYDEFLRRLVTIYRGLQPLLRPRAYLTIIVKNVKKGGRIYPLAWDLARELSGIYVLKDERIWCQDDIRLAPYGLGNAWVSNTVHHYCLQFRNEPPGGHDASR
ncbi:MAG: DNA methyltransferase [Chloroflexota bacterium]